MAAQGPRRELSTAERDVARRDDRGHQGQSRTVSRLRGLSQENLEEIGLCTLYTLCGKLLSYQKTNRRNLMPRKIAMIGAGSMVFCKTLMSDIMATPALSDSEFALMRP